MATTNLSVTITTPSGITIVEAVRLLSNKYGYQSEISEGVPNPETRTQFIKRIVAMRIQNDIKDQRTQEARQAIVLEGEITVE